MGEKLLVSPSPHVRAKGKTSLIMLMVIVALLPSCVYGVLNFGMHALLILVLSTGSAVAAELVYELVMRKKITVTDGSAAVTGLLIGMNMPPMIAWWIPVIGSVFAIVVVKQLFGGLGRNFMNRFLVLAFSAQMTAFTTGTGVLSQVTEPTVMAEAAAEADAGANENAGTDADSTATAWTEAQTEAAEKTDADSAATAETEEKGKAAAAEKTDADSAATAETEEKMRTQRQQPRRRKQQMRLPGQRLRRRQRLRKRRLRIPASWMLCRQRHR